jgi:hypothetical protein
MEQKYAAGLFRTFQMSQTYIIKLLIYGAQSVLQLYCELDAVIEGLYIASQRIHSTHTLPEPKF